MRWRIRSWSPRAAALIIAVLTACGHKDSEPATKFVPGFIETAEMKEALYVVLDHTIGELDMETRIGGIEFAALEKAPRDALSLLDLPALIDRTFPREGAQ